MAITGVIGPAARAELPKSWDALAAYAGFGEAQLQQRLDWAKWRVFQTVLDAASEASVYGPIPPLVMLPAKLTALAIIGAAIDYWGRQVISEGVTGSAESRSYTDTREGLYRVQTRLLAEIPGLQAEVDMIIGPKARRRGRGVGISSSGFVTQDPADFPRFNDCTPEAAAWLYPFVKVTP